MQISYNAFRIISFKFTEEYTIEEIFNRNLIESNSKLSRNAFNIWQVSSCISFFNT